MTWEWVVLILGLVTNFTIAFVVTTAYGSVDGRENDRRESTRI